MFNLWLNTHGHLCILKLQRQISSMESTGYSIWWTNSYFQFPEWCSKSFLKKSLWLCFSKTEAWICSPTLHLIPLVWPWSPARCGLCKTKWFIFIFLTGLFTEKRCSKLLGLFCLLNSDMFCFLLYCFWNHTCLYSELLLTLHTVITPNVDWESCLF